MAQTDPWPAITFRNIGCRNTIGFCHITGNISQNCWTQPISYPTLVGVETSWTLKLVNIEDYPTHWQQLTLGTHTNWPVIRFHNYKCQNKVETSWTLKLVNIEDYLTNWQQLTLGTCTYWPDFTTPGAKIQQSTGHRFPQIKL